MKNDSTLVLDRGITDWLKILACIAVLISHYIGFVKSQGVPYSNIMMVLAHGGYWGVLVFFFLSGYGLMESQRRKALTVRTFITKRLLKVYLPAVLSAILYIAIRLIINDMQSGGGYFIGCLWGWHDGILWFIKILLILYVIFFIYTQIDLHSSNIFSIILLIAITLVTFFVFCMTKPGYMYVSIPAFFLGVFISRFSDIAYNIFNNWILSSLIILLCLSSIIIFRHHHLLVHTLTDYTFVFVLLTVLCHNCISIPAPNKHITEMTYDVYLVHYKILVLLGMIYVPIPLPLFIVITVLVTLAFYFLRKTLIRI